MLYLSFAILSSDWRGYFIVFFIWITVFSINMLCKDMSLSKKKGFEAYKKRSYLFLFKLFTKDYQNALFYTIVGLAMMKVFWIWDSKNNRNYVWTSYFF